MFPQTYERHRREPEHAVLVVTPPGGALEAFARRASERWLVSLVRDRVAALCTWGRAWPTVAVVDLELGAGASDGLELCRELRGVAPGIHLVLVTPLAAARQRVRALELGVDDCMPLPVDSAELCALLAVRLGAAEMRSSARPASTAARVQQLARSHRLSPREVQLLLLITRGEHPKEAAARLGCGYSTARTHLRRMAKKLGCSGMREVLVRFFDRDGGGEPEAPDR